MFGAKKKNEVNGKLLDMIPKQPPKEENIPVEIVQDKISLFNEVDQMITG